MDMLKSIWPTPFKIKKGNLKSFLVQLIVFCVLVALFSILIGVLSNLPVVGVIFWIIGSLIDLYSLVGVVLCILKFIGCID